MIPVFDGHVDTLSALLRDPDRPFGRRTDAGHLDAERAREGGWAGGLFAMYVADPRSAPRPRPRSRAEAAPIGPIDGPPALEATLRMIALARRLDARGELRLCTDADAVDAARADGVPAAVLALEGAEALVDLDLLDVLHALGVRALGPVWSRPNRYAHGVPFTFPGPPDSGPGLTEPGRELVRACDRLRIVLDVSHLNEAGFWEIAERSERPFVASHSACHALCPSPRNLTDAQLDALAERDGLVGLNFAAAFVREDGLNEPDTPLETLVRHLDRLVARLGEDRVGFGSDFDGATVVDSVGDAAGLPRLLDALRAHGWDEGTLRKVAYENWTALLRRVQGDA